jgi:hypothetical protein
MLLDVGVDRVHDLSLSLARRPRIGGRGREPARGQLPWSGYVIVTCPAAVAQRAERSGPCERGGSLDDAKARQVD